METESVRRSGEAEPGGDLAASIQRAKRELEQMIDLNPQAMMMVARGGVITRANRASLDLLGAGGFGDVLGKPVAGFFDGVPPALFTELLESESGHTTRESGGAVAGGPPRVFAFTAVGLDTRADVKVLMVSDVTEQRGMEAAAEKTHKTEAVRALGGALMHNINQPLTVINVRAKLMLMAIEKGRINPDDLCRSLREIMDLAMEIANIIGRVERHREFITEQYLRGLDILDIRRSGDAGDAGTSAG